MQLVTVLTTFLISMFILEANSEKYTEVEKIALEKFRPIVSNLIMHESDNDDVFLIRWLRAKKLDITKAAEMLRDAQQWRIDNKIDSILNETVYEFKPNPFQNEGFDMEGAPILVATPFGVDLRKLQTQGFTKKFERYSLQTMETAYQRVRNYSRENGREEQIFFIADFHGFNLRQHSCFSCIPLFTDIFVKMEKYYPQALKQVVIVNAPRVAVPLLEILKTVLSDHTARVLKIFPSNKKEWSDYLSKYIAPEELPPRFGGTRSSSTDN